jgi:hypothetical protein
VANTPALPTLQIPTNPLIFRPHMAAAIKETGQECC